MHEIELNKELNKFQELIDLIIFTEYCLEEGQYWRSKANIERLKFLCIKYGLLEFDEIENISNLEKKQFLEFSKNLKIQIKNQFLEFLKENF